MYGECAQHLQRRMYVAWRRKRAGSIRDRVLLSLQSEGKITLSNRVRPSADTSESQHDVDSNIVDSVRHDSNAHVSNCNHVSDLESAVRSRRCNFNGTKNGMLVCGNDRLVKSCGIERNHRLTVTRCMRKNKMNFVRSRHKQAVSTLKGTYSCVIVIVAINCLQLPFSVSQHCLKLLFRHVCVNESFSLLFFSK